MIASINIIPIATLLLLIATGLAFWQYKKDQSKQELADGPIEKKWNTISTFVFSAGIGSILMYFKIDEEAFKQVFGNIGEIIRHGEAIVGIALSTIPIVRSLFSSTK